MLLTLLNKATLLEQRCDCLTNDTEEGREARKCMSVDVKDRESTEEREARVQELSPPQWETSATESTEHKKAS